MPLVLSEDFSHCSKVVWIPAFAGMTVQAAAVNAGSGVLSPMTP